MNRGSRRLKGYSRVTEGFVILIDQRPPISESPSSSSCGREREREAPISVVQMSG